MSEFTDKLRSTLDSSARAEFGEIEAMNLDRMMSRVGMTEYPQVTGNPDGDLACGDCECTVCGLPYFAHPDDWRVVGYGNVPFLTVLCDGQRVKL